MPDYQLKVGQRTLIVRKGQHDIGRMTDCWLILDDELVSRYHARLHVRGDVEIEDLGSRNGTFVNDSRIQRRHKVRDGDQIRIGREIMHLIGGDEVTSDEAVEEQLGKTLAPGEDTQFPTLMSQLVEKSLKVGKIKEAERYALALTNQLSHSPVAVDHPAATSCVACLVALAQRSASGVWIDRVFRLYATHHWMMSDQTMESIRQSLDRIARIPGSGLRDYEQTLRAMAREGDVVPRSLRERVAELADSYAVE